MPEIGYSLSCEEHGPNDLVRYARRAEQAGFGFATISDHYHPWTNRQGNSPFAWAVIGGIAATTQRLRLGTGVTCPIMRYHPAIIAQAAATAAVMMPGRFFLGLGSGENLNEHIMGQHWPSADVRREMMKEAVEIVRLLWQGGVQSYQGLYFTVENARIYTLPDELPPIYLAAAGPKAADLAGRIGDGMIGTAPKKDLLQKFDASGGANKPHYGQLTVCWAEDETQAQRTAYEWWPNAALTGEISQELSLPTFFEQACSTVREEDVAKTIICGPDPQRHIQAIQQYLDASYEYVSVHQVGPDQEGFFRFYEKNILPRFG